MKIFSFYSHKREINKSSVAILIAKEIAQRIKKSVLSVTLPTQEDVTTESFPKENYCDELFTSSFKNESWYFNP